MLLDVFLGTMFGYYMYKAVEIQLGKKKGFNAAGRVKRHRVAKTYGIA